MLFCVRYCPFSEVREGPLLDDVTHQNGSNPADEQLAPNHWL